MNNTSNMSDPPTSNATNYAEEPIEETISTTTTMTMEDAREDPPSDIENSNDDNAEMRSSGSVRTSTTNGSIYGGEAYVPSQPDSANGEYQRISRSGEERIEQVLAQKFDAMHQTKGGLEKLGAYVLLNEENAVPLESQSISINLSQDDEEASLDLSSPSSLKSLKNISLKSLASAASSVRPTCSAEQLERWIQEVNIAVGREAPPRLQVQASTTCTTAEEEGNITDASIDAVSENMIAAIMLASSNHQQQCATTTPREKNPLSPRAADNKQHADVVTTPSPSIIKTDRNVKEPIKTDFSLEKPKMSVVQQEDVPTKHPFAHLMTPVGRKPRTNNSKMIMASIEGKYKNLRDNLMTTDPTVEEEEKEEEEKDRQMPPSLNRSLAHKATATIGNPVRQMVSAVISSRDALRNEYARDHFSLGMLSTHSSGILCSNSWSTTDSFESEIDQYLPGSKGCGIGKGCGMFLCD